jgi:hypothetical protein
MPLAFFPTYPVNHQPTTNKNPNRSQNKRIEKKKQTENCPSLIAESSPQISTQPKKDGPHKTRRLALSSVFDLAQ